MLEIYWNTINEEIDQMSEEELERMGNVFIEVYESIPQSEMVPGFDIQRYTETHPEVLGTIMKGLCEVVNRRKLICA